MPVKSRECIAVGVDPTRDDRAGNADRAQLFGGGHDGETLLLGNTRDPVRRALVIGMAGMGHDARQFDARRLVQDARDVEQAGQGGIGEASPAAAAVDLDEDGEGVAVRRRRGDGLGHAEIVRDDAQVHAAPAQFRHRAQLGRDDADAVEDVLEAAVGESSAPRRGSRP
jgi:hypothetical protein